MLAVNMADVISVINEKAAPCGYSDTLWRLLVVMFITRKEKSVRKNLYNNGFMACF